MTKKLRFHDFFVPIIQKAYHFLYTKKSNKALSVWNLLGPTNHLQCLALPLTLKNMIWVGIWQLFGTQVLSASSTWLLLEYQLLSGKINNDYEKSEKESNGMEQAQLRLSKLGPGTVLIFYKSFGPTPIYIIHVKICLSRLCMNMSSLLFVRTWAMPRILYLSCGIPFPV